MKSRKISRLEKEFCRLYEIVSERYPNHPLLNYGCAVSGRFKFNIDGDLIEPYRKALWAEVKTIENDRKYIFHEVGA
jgi:hypothetical protein